VEERPQASYYVDESDPDIAILRRQDGSFVAAFSARGVTGRVSSKRLGRITGTSCGFTGPGKLRTPKNNRARDPEPRLIHQPPRRCVLESLAGRKS
jgi:hypothetical protein